MVCFGFREAVEHGQRLLLFIDWAETGYVLRQRLTAIVSMGTQTFFFFSGRTRHVARGGKDADYGP